MELTGVHLLLRYLLLDQNLISGEGYTLFEDAYIVRGLVFPSLAGGSRVLVRGEEPILMSADTANGVISYQGTACKKQARREESTKRIDSFFLNGTKFTGKRQDVEKAQRTWEKIYGTAASEGS